MYTEGDFVFYPKGGVFQVAGLSEKTISDRSIPFFDLVSSDGKTKISIPKQNIDRVGVRALLTLDELEEVLADCAPDSKIQKLHHKNRKNRFEVFRQTGIFSEMCIVIVTIHKLISIGKATFEEKRIYEQVRKRLVDEIAIIKDLETKPSEKFLMAELDEAILREEKSIDDDEDSDQSPDGQKASDQSLDVQKASDQSPDVQKASDQSPDGQKASDQSPDVQKTDATGAATDNTGKEAGAALDSKNLSFDSK